MVAALAASAVDVLPGVTITATRRLTRSASRSVTRVLSLYAKRNSTITLRRSTKPVSPKPLRNAATTPVLSSGVPGYHRLLPGLDIRRCASPVAVVTGNFLHEHHDPAPQGRIINSQERSDQP